MTERIANDILENYRQTSAKLKKRFLRKPNVTEACESFTALGAQFERAEMPAYAGMCFNGAARCEGSLGNIPGEAASLLRAARQFSQSQLKNNSLKCPGPNEDNFLAALSCYSHASSRYPENCPLNINTNLEMAKCLEDLDKDVACEVYLKNAVSLADNSLDTKVFCLGELASNYIKIGNYIGALETISESINLLTTSPINSARSDVLKNSEISTILLLLLLKPSPQILSPNLLQLLDKYANGDNNNKLFRMSAKQFLLLQTLVLTCQSSDYTTLNDIQSQLYGFFNKDQRELFHILVENTS